MEKIITVAANCMAGQKRNGAQLGSDQILKSYDLIVPHESFVNNKGYQELYDGILRSFSDNFHKKVILIGGDHSVAASSISAINDTYVNKNLDQPFIIWIDAHADINTFDTSVTKNIHGMPVAFLMRLCDQDYVKFNNALMPNKIIYIGLRDVDPPEWTYIEKLGIKYYDMDFITKFGIDYVISEIKSKVGDNYIHISLDIDGIDPNYIPSTGTAVPDGLSVEDVTKVINSLKSDKLKSIDIVEFNPLIGSIDDVNLTISNIKKCLDVFIN